MRRRAIRIDPQRRLVMLARLVVPVGAQQQIGEIDMPHRVVGVMQDRLRIDPAGGVDRAHLGQERAEFVQRAEMRRRAPQDIDEGLLGVLPPVQRAEQHRALDLGVDGIASRARRASISSSCRSRDSCASRGAQPAMLLATSGRGAVLAVRSGPAVHVGGWLCVTPPPADSRAIRSHLIGMRARHC